jgi:hypothetical protein
LIRTGIAADEPTLQACVQQDLDFFTQLPSREIDETRWIALKYSCSTAHARRLIAWVRQRRPQTPPATEQTDHAAQDAGWAPRPPQQDAGKFPLDNSAN